MRLGIPADEVKAGDTVLLDTGDEFRVKHRASVDVIGHGTLVVLVPEVDRLYQTSDLCRERLPSFGALDLVNVERP